MSGICGVVDFDAPVDRRVVEAMAAAAAHRGPDGIELDVRGGVGLAHLAFWVTPESTCGFQPIIGEGGVRLVADARIDNRADLLAALQPMGMVGPRSSDVEIIMAAYRYWDTGCPSHLIGDFAFAVWDDSRRLLFAARDVMGMRPFHYQARRRRLVFGSEAKQVLAAPAVRSRHSARAAVAYLLNLPTPPDWTAFEDVTALAPGHALVADETGTRSWRFWSFGNEPRAPHRSPEEYGEEFRHIFFEAVRSRLRSIWPVGISLSGGLDSMSVAATAGRLQEEAGGALVPELRAYCWAFSHHKDCDERAVSGPLAEHYRLALTEIPADDAWPLRLVESCGPDHDSPRLGPYQAAWNRSAGIARQEGTRLVLTGAFGDLAVGESIFDEVGLLTNGHLVDLARELCWHHDDGRASWARTLGSCLVRPTVTTLMALGAPCLARRWFAARRPVPVWIPRDLASRHGLDVWDGTRPPAALRSPACRARYRLISAEAHMATYWERVHARFGLAYADPWADRRVAEFILSIPQWAVQRRSERKAIARRAMAGVIPAAVLTQGKKMGLEPLFFDGLRNHERHTVRALLTETHGAAYGYFDEVALRNHFDSFVAGGCLDAGPFWRALTLELWLRLRAASTPPVQEALTRGGDEGSDSTMSLRTRPAGLVG